VVDEFSFLRHAWNAPRFTCPASFLPSFLPSFLLPDLDKNLNRDDHIFYENGRYLRSQFAKEKTDGAYLYRYSFSPEADN